MSRHRNVRSMNYEDEYYDEDDYGHSVEDNYCISPGTAAQFTYHRSDRNVALSNFMGEEGGIPEEDEDREDLSEDPTLTPHEYIRPKMSDMDEAKLNSCLEEVRNVLGETVPEPVVVETILRHNFSIDSSLNELLNQQEAPKPQRQPKQNRRNRSKDQLVFDFDPCESDGTASDVQDFTTSRPTVILQQPPGRPQKQEPTQPYPINTQATPQQVVNVAPKIVNQSTTTKQSQQVSQSERNNKTGNGGVNSSSNTDDKTFKSSEPVKFTLAEPDKGDKVDNKKVNQTVNVKQSQSKNDTVSASPAKILPGNKKDLKTGGSSKDGTMVTEEEKSSKDTMEAEKTGGKPDSQLLTPKKERFIPPLPRSGSKTKYEKFDLKAEYQKRQTGKDMLNMVVIGHVDAGKSTLMGHLLYQLGSVNQRAMHKYEQESKKLGKSSFAYAWVLDETEEERVRGVTMDIAQTKFETPHKIITLLDAPGHKDFIPNMITGTAQADVAILVVNATKGEFETGFESGGQTREHALLARSLGVSQLIVAVNKMDTVEWQQDRYNDVVRKLGSFLKLAGFRDSDVAYIPVSGLGGENLAKAVNEPKLNAWYTGSTLVEQIDKFKSVVRPVDKPLRIMISDVFKGMGAGLTATGKIASGSVQIGDRLLVMPANEYSMVKGVSINDEGLNYAFAGDHVNVIITGVDATHIGCGSVLSDAMTPVKCATRILARIVLFNLEIPVTRGFTVIFHYQSVTEPAIVKKLVSQLNKSTGEVVKNKPKCLMKNTSAVVEIEFERPVCVELYKDNKELGRFMLRYAGHTIAAGLVEEVLKTKTGVDTPDNQGATGS